MPSDLRKTDRLTGNTLWFAYFLTPRNGTKQCICITYDLGASASYRISLRVVFVADLSDSVFDSQPVLTPMDSQQLGKFA